MVGQVGPFSEVAGFVASATVTTEDFEYLGVVVIDIKTGLNTLCVLRKLISDRAGADFSVYDLQDDGVPKSLTARFMEQAPTLVSSVSEARRLLSLPPHSTEAEEVLPEFHGVLEELLGPHGRAA